MNLNVQNILIGCLVILLAWDKVFPNKEFQEPKPITITMPEIKGGSGEKTIADWNNQQAIKKLAMRLNYLL